ncbi:MAG: hypothetical protein ABIK27_02830, partial [Bacteroidota bacterium]
MKTFVKILLAILIISTMVEAQKVYPYKTIRDIQFVHPDSLLVADQIQNSQLSRWKIQASSLYLTDTVRIVGVCTVPAKVINFTSSGYNIVLADTGYSGPWGHMFIRAPIGTGSADSIYYQAMLNIEIGDIVEVVGWVDEFPALNGYGISSTTQFVPLRDPNYANIGSATPPPIYKLTAADFFIGAFPSGPPYPPNGIKFSTGEPYEAAIVELTNLTVVSYVSAGNGTVNLMDDFGNNFSTLDVSKWWTLRVHRDPASTYTIDHPLMKLFTRVDTIRGYITSNSGMENARGYRICPIFPGDVIIGIARPWIYSVYRYPVIVTEDSSTKIQAVIRPGPQRPIANRILYYSINHEPFNTIEME